MVGRGALVSLVCLFIRLDRSAGSRALLIEHSSIISY